MGDEARAFPELARRMRRLGTESAFDVLVRARELESEGRSVIHLEIGEPDFPTPPHIVEAAKKALDDGETHYGPAQGLPELRDAIAGWVSRSRGLELDGGNVAVVPGGKPILFFSMIALLEEGDEVLYPDPGFPIYESVIRFVGAVPVPIPLSESRGFSLDLDALAGRLSERTRMVILNSPGNPTGAVVPAEDMEAISGMLYSRDLVVLSDEIYSRIVYEAMPPSIASFDPRLEKTIILDGFSKTYAMTGWRLGYGVMSTKLASALAKLMVNSNSCTATFTQRAGLAALDGPQEAVSRMLAEFRRRRDAIVAGLNAIPGFRCTLPAGAFYAFPNVTGTGIPSAELADMLLNDAGVACVSGESFGRGGEGYLRFSYANSMENIAEAVRRIRERAALWEKGGV